MTVQSTSTFKLVPPRRPGLADISDGTKSDDLRWGPLAESMPNSQEDNQRAALIQAACDMMPVARVWVKFVSGAPTVFAVKCPNDAVTTASFVPTDGGAGVTTIAWAANLLSPPDMPPQASSLEGAKIIGTTQISDRSVRIDSTDAAGTFVDCAFLLTIY